MSAATLVETAALEGVELRMVNGELKVHGERAAVARWLPAIREHKSELLALLSANEAAPVGRFDDLSPEGRAAGERILAALQSPAPKAPGEATGDDRGEAGTAPPTDRAPERKAAETPLSAAELRTLSAWLDRIGETDTAIRTHLLAQCRDPEARRYFIRFADELAMDGRP